MGDYKIHQAFFEQEMWIENHSQIEKSLEKKTFFENEGFKIVKAMSLALSILIVCYYGSKYNVLQNGQIHRGFPSRRTVVEFNFGYFGYLHSLISPIMAGMLIYSIIMKRPQFSLPFIGFFLAELICDFCDVIITIWYLFKYLQIQTALLYAVGLILLIFAEIWTWLDVVWLYEHRNFKIH